MRPSPPSLTKTTGVRLESPLRAFKRRRCGQFQKHLSSKKTRQQCFQES
nr:MAG TPA: hypothetical protein [Caudoviricetes sp.]